MTNSSSRKGLTALVVAHVVGMVDMVAPPVWVGTLVSQYGFDPQQAGGLVTLFLIGAVLASLWFAPRFERLNSRLLATAGFTVTAIAFYLCSTTRDFGLLAALHLVGGLFTGMALSVTHGSMGCTANPHRMFAIANTALGVFAVVFLGATPQLVAALGGQALFQVFLGVMVVGAVVSALAFPAMQGSRAQPAGGAAAHGPLSRAVWCGIIGVSCMTLVQATVFSFVERMGADRGFAVTAVLITLGLVNLFPAAIAAGLQKRLDARTVLIAGPLVQLVLALGVTQSSTFLPYAVASALFIAPMLFTHVFAFGVLAKLDPSGRATAGTPAMTMLGSAIGPLLGGTLVKGIGYGSLGVLAVVVDLLALYLFMRVLPARSVALKPASS